VQKNIYKLSDSHKEGIFEIISTSGRVTPFAA